MLQNELRATHASAQPRLAKGGPETNKPWQAARRPPFPPRRKKYKKKFLYWSALCQLPADANVRSMPSSAASCPAVSEPGLQQKSASTTVPPGARTRHSSEMKRLLSLREGPGALRTRFEGVCFVCVAGLALGSCCRPSPAATQNPKDPLLVGHVGGRLHRKHKVKGAVLKRRRHAVRQQKLGAAAEAPLLRERVGAVDLGFVGFVFASGLMSARKARHLRCQPQTIFTPR